MKYRLTQFSHGAGCGCKISPQILSQILNVNTAVIRDPRLLVGNEKRDDAAVYDLGDGKAIISTTDFFMPIVDDAYDFGCIAAANAISDIYAMGGTPFLAIAILGWPVNLLPPEVAAEVMKGAIETCASIGVQIAGGHSIDCPEPIFGLAVTGQINIDRLKTNAGAKEGDFLILTKPLGVGILTTAEKKNLLKVGDIGIATKSMKDLNSIGEQCSTFQHMHAMTDITGFGLFGHLLEMMEASGTIAELDLKNIPLLIPHLGEYIDQKAVPGGTLRNWDGYGEQIVISQELDAAFTQAILADPQTSGGLLMAVSENGVQAVEEILRRNHKALHIIGRVKRDNGQKHRIKVV